MVTNSQSNGKRKRGILQIFTAGFGRRFRWVFPSVALLTFIFSWAALFSRRIVERWYAHVLFPRISHAAGRFADAAPFAWLDLMIVLGVIFFLTLVLKRRWTWLLNIVALLYLIFFWSWGLNYHREPLA